MYIEINENDAQVISRSFNTKENQRMTRYEQSAYLWMPGAPYPLPFKIEVPGQNEGYQPGKYVLSADSVRTNNFGALEFNRFGMRLVRANIADSKPSAPKAVNA